MFQLVPVPNIPITYSKKNLASPFPCLPMTQTAITPPFSLPSWSLTCSCLSLWHSAPRPAWWPPLASLQHLHAVPELVNPRLDTVLQAS